MSPINELVRRRPLLTYFVLTFAISWGGFVLAVGPRGFASTNWEAESGFLPAVIAMLDELGELGASMIRAGKAG